MKPEKTALERLRELLNKWENSGFGLLVEETEPLINSAFTEGLSKEEIEEKSNKIPYKNNEYERLVVRVGFEQGAKWANDQLTKRKI